MSLHTEHYSSSYDDNTKLAVTFFTIHPDLWLYAKCRPLGCVPLKKYNFRCAIVFKCWGIKVRGEYDLTVVTSRSGAVVTLSLVCERLLVCAHPGHVELILRIISHKWEKSTGNSISTLVLNPTGSVNQSPKQRVRVAPQNGKHLLHSMT